MSDSYIHIKKEGDHFRISGETHFVAGKAPINSVKNKANECFASWDWDGSILEVRNCRYGFLPLYYYTKANEVCISTSILLLLNQGAPDGLDDVALSVFVRLGFFLGEDTAFKAIKCLPPENPSALSLFQFHYGTIISLFFSAKTSLINPILSRIITKYFCNGPFRVH